jgi:hypothetical protein
MSSKDSRDTGSSNNIKIREEGRDSKCSNRASNKYGGNSGNRSSSSGRCSRS